MPYRIKSPSEWGKNSGCQPAKGEGAVTRHKLGRVSSRGSQEEVNLHVEWVGWQGWATLDNGKTIF